MGMCMDTDNYDDGKRFRRELFQQRYFARIDSYSDKTDRFAVLMIQIVSTFNGGSIIALLSFIAANRDHTGAITGVSAIICFGVALLMVLGAILAGFFFYSRGASAFAHEALNEDRSDYLDRNAFQARLNEIGEVRLIAIRLMFVAVGFSVIGSYLFAVYLLGLT